MVQRVDAYFPDILEYLLAKEAKETSSAGCLGPANAITPKVREILVDWMVDVAVKFRLGSETLFLAVLYLDRGLGRLAVGEARLQLLGTCALFVAAKLEEVYPPRVEDFAQTTAGACSPSALLALEPELLAALDFDLTRSTALRFLSMFGRAVGLGARPAMTGRYLCELALTQTACATMPPSLLAAGVVYLVGRLFQADREWPPALELATGRQLADVRAAAKPVYLGLLATRLPGACSAVVRKFATDKYLNVAALRVEHHC
jgi:hypothetical protein